MFARRFFLAVFVCSIGTTLALKQQMVEVLPMCTCTCEVPETSCVAPPTFSPTSAVPTTAPTASPSVSPTAAPTTAPTLSPTQAPTQAPTQCPTATPTAAPSGTVQPTITTQPTVQPSAQPTNAPGAVPTEFPTASPTAAISAAPTLFQEVSCSRVVDNLGEGNSVARVLFDDNAPLGYKNMTYDAYTLPDRFRIVYKGAEVANSGFRGSRRYSGMLNDLGYPEVSGPGYGFIGFNLTDANVRFADVYVDAPLPGTGWVFFMPCNETSVAPAFPLALGDDDAM